MIPQSYPLYVTWWTDDQSDMEKWPRFADGSDRTAAAYQAGQIRWIQTGLVIGWWTLPGGDSAVLVPVVVVDDEPAGPVVADGAHFFYSLKSGKASAHEALTAFANASLPGPAGRAGREEWAKRVHNGIMSALDE